MEFQHVVFHRWWESSLLSFSPSLSHTHVLFFIIDTPEVAPGVLLGASGATVTATGSGAQSPHITSSASSAGTGDSSSPHPTSASTGGSSSNIGAIVGGAVGGVAAISIAVAAIFFFLRRQRPQAAPAVAAPGFGAFQPPMDEIQRPLTTDDVSYMASSQTVSSMPGTPVASMRLYVRVFVPNLPSRFSVYSPHVRFFLTFFHYSGPE